jgi:hypothetical protein
MAEKKRLNISFTTFDELNTLQNEKKYKIAGRNTLGVKEANEEDWINDFNIGNIMHLQALGFDELNYQVESRAPAEYGGSRQQSSNFILNEISKDSLMFKTLYSIVAYFCIGTELRFLAVLNPHQYTLKDSEIWHAKAIHISSYFLPNECPLISHIS